MEVELNDVRVVHVRRDRVQHRGPRVVIRARVEVDRLPRRNVGMMSGWVALVAGRRAHKASALLGPHSTTFVALELAVAGGTRRLPLLFPRDGCRLCECG